MNYRSHRIFQQQAGDSPATGGLRKRAAPTNTTDAGTDLEAEVVAALAARPTEDPEVVRQEVTVAFNERATRAAEDAARLQREADEREAAARVAKARQEAEDAVKAAQEAERKALAEAQAKAAGDAAAAKLRAENLLASSDFVMVESPREVIVTMAHGVVVKIPKGVVQVAKVVAEHWFAKNSGVKVIDPVAIAQQRLAEAKKTAEVAEQAAAAAIRAKELAAKK